MDVLHDRRTMRCKPIETHVDPSVKLGLEGGKEVNKVQYQRLVSKLIYLTHTLLDIAFVVSVVSQFMH